jgi:8-oxo-dGTP pyrophosphatase MutT (NUDIX family)
MGFDDRYRLSAHAVITDEAGRVLLLQATYGDRRWGLPGGAVDPGETLPKRSFVSAKRSSVARFR